MLAEELRPRGIAQRTAFDEAGAYQVGIKSAHRMVVIDVHGVRDGIAVIKANEDGIDGEGAGELRLGDGDGVLGGRSAEQGHGQFIGLAHASFILAGHFGELMHAFTQLFIALPQHRHLPLDQRGCRSGRVRQFDPLQQLGMLGEKIRPLLDEGDDVVLGRSLNCDLFGRDGRQSKLVVCTPHAPHALSP